MTSRLKIEDQDADSMNYGGVFAQKTFSSAYKSAQGVGLKKNFAKGSLDRIRASGGLPSGTNELLSPTSADSTLDI